MPYGLVGTHKNLLEGSFEIIFEATPTSRSAKNDIRGELLYLLGFLRSFVIRLPFGSKDRSWAEHLARSAPNYGHNWAKKSQKYKEPHVWAKIRSQLTDKKSFSGGIFSLKFHQEPFGTLGPMLTKVLIKSNNL